MQPSHIGSYPVLRLLGEGATGLVYAGQDSALQREVAIKVLRSGVGESVEKRFVREGRLLARLRHPGIVGVHGVGLHAGRPYLVMDLLVGSSLEERLGKHGAYTWGEAVELAAAISDALSYAHRMGVLHRDLKPENVVLDAEGRPILTDFGLGKAVDSTTQVSVEGALLGTPAYWAPEQARGDLSSMGPTTDVYGVGGILYALLTGEGPNRGRSMAELVTSMRVLPPPPSRLARGEVPRELDAVCLRALARAPKDRFSSMLELSEVLRGLTRVSGESRAPWFLTMAASAAAIGLAVTLWSSRRAQTQGLSPVAHASARPSAETSPRDSVTASATPRVEPTASQGGRSAAEAPLSEAEAERMEVRLRAITRASEPGQALELAEELVRRAPTRPYGHAVRSSILTQRGRGGEAFAGYVAADLLAPGQPQLELGLIGAGIRLEEDFLPRLEHLVRLPQPRLRSAALLARATLYHSRGAFQLAIKDYRAYLRLEPKDASVREKHALALFDAREFGALRLLLPNLRGTSRGGYFFVLGELEAAGKALGESREPEARLMRAAAGGAKLPTRVPAGYGPHLSQIHRFLSGHLSAGSLVAAMGKEALWISQAHFYVGLDALTRGEVGVATRHFRLAEAKSSTPTLERSLSRWYGDRLRSTPSPMHNEEAPPEHWAQLKGEAVGADRARPRGAFESDLLLELYPSNPTLLYLNARSTWGPRAGITLARLVRLAALAKGERRLQSFQNLGSHQLRLRRWAEAERTFSQLLELAESPLARGARGTALVALRRIPEALADFEFVLKGGSEGLREKIWPTLGSAYFLARKDDLALSTYAAEKESPPAVNLNLLLIGWAMGREDLWRARLAKFEAGIQRDVWGHALGELPPPTGAQAWVSFLEGRASWLEAGLPMRAPGLTSYRVASGVYFATRGATLKAREQFKIARKSPYEQASIEAVVASRWLMDHPESPR